MQPTVVQSAIDFARSPKMWNRCLEEIGQVVLYFAYHHNEGGEQIMILGFFELFFLQGGETSEIQFPRGNQSSRSMIETRAEPMPCLQNYLL